LSPQPAGVIFDFYGTLTVGVTVQQLRSDSRRIANASGLPESALFQTMSNTFTPRATGLYGDMEETIREVARVSGHHLDAAATKRACDAQIAIGNSTSARLRREAVATLRWLRASGMVIGVISDCTHELPLCWADLPIAPFVSAAIFSVEAGYRKPHPHLYRDMCAALDRHPNELLYVGDGGSNELTGAIRSGMSAALLRTSDNVDAVIYDPETEWLGPVIDGLDKLPALLGIDEVPPA
jgi:putative hydrolase of the HAD superfamily